MDDMLALEGGAAATVWQKRHAKRKAREAAKKLRAQIRAEKKTDFIKRVKKWKAKVAALKAAGLPTHGVRYKPRDLRRPQWIDMTGRRYGRLTVIRVAPVSKNGGQRCRRWWVKCDCGTGEHLVSGTCLRQGIVQSCGCLWSEVVKENWRSGRLAKMQAARDRLKRSPLSIQLAELRRRILDGKRVIRRDSKLLTRAWEAIVEDEVRQGIRRRGKSGARSLFRQGSSEQRNHCVR